MRFVGFIGPSYKLRSVNVDCQRCINLYPEINEIGTGKEKEVAALVSTPGLSLLATIGAGPIRGEYTATNGTLYVVSGSKLYSVSSAWAATELGTLNSSTGKVSMVDNGVTLVVVDGEDGYALTMASASFAEITDPGFLGANQVTYQDGYFIFTVPNSGQFQISELDAVTFDALDFSEADVFADGLVGTISNNREVWLFGESTTEVWYNSGNSDFPFERISGGFIETGCAARHTIVKMLNTVFWLGKDDEGSGIVYMANGFQPVRISTHALEQAIQGYGDLSNSSAYTYQSDGHYFYVLNFESADTTWVYDLTTKLWHERVYTNQGAFERHRADCHAYAYSTHVVGDYETGKIYQLSNTVYTDDGTEITRQRVAPHIAAGSRRVFYSSFQLDMETGVGLDGIAQGTDPQAMLQFSDDGGHSWSSERWMGFGKIGERKRRAIWRRLGQSRDRVFRITITDPVKVTMIGVEING